MYAWIVKNRKEHLEFPCPICGQLLTHKNIEETHFTDDFIKHVSESKPELNLKTTGIRNKSADTIDKLIRLDDFSLEYIKDVIIWGLRDDFWGKNLYSLSPLRKKSNNELTKFQNIANSYQKKKNNKTSDHNFEEVVYEGTKPEDIKW